MPIFAVDYAYSEQAAAGRDTYRPEHRAWLAGLRESGIVLSSGPYPNGSGALLIFRAEDAAALKDLLTQDPFARESLIDDVRAVEWAPTSGPFTS
ncbi:YciI family protein [Nocardia sp. R6R-6]|uniref:YciI family protein n=1 Tax=Nocardia sp. R6R-6 TaxID=3459303 RepID=UPI00403DF071